MKPSELMSYLWYPLSFSIAIALFAILLAQNMPLPIVLYVPIALNGILVMGIEFAFPERKEWRPKWSDIQTDAAFMAVVQIILPKMLMVLVTLAIADQLHAEAATVSIWPHTWPLPAQALLMILSVDLMRYWLHRACHHFTVLWRLHEIHHSPEILYTINTGRFHPLEKVLHFSLDTVPFLLLGVAPEVFAAYFLLYSVNGFFQHSNARIRYGWLNYFVGSAETHRWHHAQDPQTASCNFGSSTVIWDIVFGTWYLPKNNQVEKVGILNDHYPKDFWSQLMAPFKQHRG